MAKKIQKYDECARIKRQWFKSKMGDEGDLDKAEGWVITGAMSAAAAIKHEHTIKEVIQALIEPVEERRAVSDEPTGEYGGGSILKVPPDNISTFVCHLTAQMLVDRKRMDESNESANRIDSQSKGTKDTWEDECVVSLHSSEPSPSQRFSVHTCLLQASSRRVVGSASTDDKTGDNTAESINYLLPPSS